MSEEGTITPEVQIGQLEEALATETDRRIFEFVNLK
jgi:hypothetical protein